MALLCFNFIDAFSQSFNDCADAFPVCEMKTYHFGYLNGPGNIKESFNSENCFSNSNMKETNSLWLNWSIESSGTLIFTINPEQPLDDLDFVLYKKDGDCTSLVSVRCMASGENIGNGQKEGKCLGETGLRLESLDEFESQGCKYNDDNFLKYLSAESGEEYLLLVNNYNSNDGFSISFEGSCKFKSSDQCEFIHPNEEILITNLFPNPTTDEINVQFITHNKKEYSLKILDISGKEIYTSSKKASMGLDHANISVADYLPGTYILVVSADGYSTAKRFVKK